MSIWDKKITGPDSSDSEQKIGIFTNGSYDSIYYNATWNGSNTSFVSMVIQINGIPKAVIDFTQDRIGEPFGYAVGPELGESLQTDNGPKFFGTFAVGTVNVT